MTRPQNNHARIVWLEDIGNENTQLVGGKAAALGEMYGKLQPLGIRVPNGFVITTHAYGEFVQHNKLQGRIRHELARASKGRIKEVQQAGRAIRTLLLNAELQPALQQGIRNAYTKLGKRMRVAVRSSAVGEDAQDASFAGQQETYVHIAGEAAVLRAVQQVFASLFTDRAISYRAHKNIAAFGIMAVCVQEMVRSDKGCSGVLFTVDPETGFENALFINAVYGLGELLAQGEVIPDEYVVHKPFVRNSASHQGIVAKTHGAKMHKLVCGAHATKKVAVSQQDRLRFCLTDNEILQLASWGVAIEEHFKGAMDIEWAKDGISGQLYIVQARPETVHSKKRNTVQEFRLQQKAIPVVMGIGVGMKIATGKVACITSPKDIGKFHVGDILVTHNTDPDWEPIMKGAAAIVTDKGGRTSHAAIVAREFGIPALVGTEYATKKLRPGQTVTVDCSSGDTGFVYQGAIPFRVVERNLAKVPAVRTKIMLNIGAPEEAYKNAYLPVQGVGLGRIEFIINSAIRIHPNALIEYKKLPKKIQKEIGAITVGYADKKQYYVDKLAEGIGKIASAFWPHEVIIRFSDFKTNEYKQLLGGELYEPVEQNSMLGWRGAARYYDPAFKQAFGLECAAIRKVRGDMGFRNVTPMVPFCRTPEEGEKVLEVMANYGLSKKGDPKLQVYVMCEIPSNVIQADEFLDVFDGMSIGSNDLTQLALGIDRDSGMGASIANENSSTVRHLVATAIAACNKRNKYIGICGQGPSDYPDFAKFLVEQGIGSISLNPDAVIPTITRIARLEKKMQTRYNTCI